MDRRDVLRAGVALGFMGLDPGPLVAEPEAARVMTVRGPIAPEEMGPTLPHEHVLVDFIGAEKVSRDRYDADEVFRIVSPHLKRIRQQGIRTVAECTPAFLGRDPALLRRLAEASGLDILTNTGYYGANSGKHLPEHSWTETADELAARWLREWHEGIEGTGIRPGFIKIGTDAGPLPTVNRTLVRAAARAHLRSGLTIAAHTGDGQAAREELDVLRAEGVDASAFIWVHAQNEPDPAVHTEAAERGAWVEFDGIGPGTIERHVRLVRAMKERGHLDRVLLSHDAGWYHVGEPDGGQYRPYDTLLAEFVPALKAAGVTGAEVDRLLVDNPRAAFAIRERRAR